MTRDPLSHGLWEASAPPALPMQSLLGETKADVVIVGAGFTGCSAALHLASAGCAPVVIEANEIGFGGSGRNVGLVNAGMWVMPNDLLANLGSSHGERLLAQLGDAPQLVFDIVERYGITCEATRNGTLHCAVGRKGLAEISERARQWLARGADVELLDAERVAPMIGSHAYSGALLDRRAGTIQPLAYVRGLATQATNLGTQIFTGSAVTGCQDLGSGWRLTTATGSVVAQWVIVATDAYSSGVWSGLKLEQILLPYFQMATRPLHPVLQKQILPERQGTWDTRKILSSFRMDAAGRLVFGSVGALRGPGKSIHIDWGKRELTRLFPQLGMIDLDHSWYGMIGMTDNAVPRLHMHGRNMVSVSGFNGRGIAPCTTFGRDLARLALGETTIDELALPLTNLRGAPFHTLRGAFYEVGAQLAHFAGTRF